MKIKIKDVLIILLAIISIVVIYKIPKLLINKNNKSLPEVKLREIKNSKAFAIMIQNETGYEEYNKDTWPTEGYKFKEAKCIDNNGSLVDKAITYNNGKVSLTTNQTIYCTLYFDKKLGISALDIVASKPKSLSPNPDQGDMYRYQGTSELVNDNYICFGTKEREECTNDEDHYMYRIIGITPEGEMKLIKQTPVVEQGNTVFSWYKATGTDENGNTLYGTAEDGLETWPESAIYKRLNGLSNGTITGDGQNAAKYSTNKNINADTDIFVDSSEYDYLKSGDSINGTKDNKGSEWYQLIADYNWMYGDSIEEIYDGHKMYQIETGQIETKYRYLDKEKGHYVEGTYFWNTEKDKVSSKIGLPYSYDILLTYYDGEKEKSRGNPNNSSFSVWLNNKVDTFAGATMDRCDPVWGEAGPSTDTSIKSYNNNGMYTDCSVVNVYPYLSGLKIYPTFYLPNTIEMEGTGIETDPYIIVN